MKKFEDLRTLIVAIVLFVISLGTNYWLFNHNNNDIAVNRRNVIESFAIYNLDSETSSERHT